MTSKPQPLHPIVSKEDSVIRSQAQRVSAYEVEVREFAAQYPTPTVREALTWRVREGSPRRTGGGPMNGCPCECNSGGFCGGCGHAGCGGRR